MINLCSKMYSIENWEAGLSEKFSSKGRVCVCVCVKIFKNHFLGLSAKALKEECRRQGVSSTELFKKVLYSGEAAGGVNQGFIVRDNQVVTYEQERQSIVYFYCKRKVLEDGISTVPLDITLKVVW